LTFSLPDHIPIPVTPVDLVALVVWAGHLAVGMLVLLQPERNSLVRPMGLVAFSMVGWSFADFLYHLTGHLPWHWVDLGVSPFTPTLGLHLGATFVGLTRGRRLTVRVAYVWSAGLAVISWAAFGLPDARELVASSQWDLAYLGLDGSALLVATVWLGLHLRRAAHGEERARTRTMLAAMLVGGLLATTDFFHDLGAPVPPLANIGSLLCSALLALATLRLRIFGRNLPLQLAVLAGVLAAGGAIGYVALFRGRSGSTAALMVGTSTLTVVLMVAVHQIARAHFRRRDRTEALARLGRFSAQMAHDLKNPLAALKGAVQFLGKEVSGGGSLAEQTNILGLLLQQVDRLNDVVDGYAGLGREQPDLVNADLNAVVRGALALQRYVRPNITVESHLDEGLPRCPVDVQLLGRALENLVRNGIEAMPNGGVLTVRTTPQRSHDRVVGVSVTVQDNGVGMDARSSARAFEDFYTTKPHGSGLGLAFIKRVMQAHGGRVQLTSKLGGGTIVTLHFFNKSEAWHGPDWPRPAG